MIRLDKLLSLDIAIFIWDNRLWWHNCINNLCLRTAVYNLNGWTYFWPSHLIQSKHPEILGLLVICYMNLNWVLFIFKLAVSTWYSFTQEILFFDFVSLDLWHEVLIKILFHFFCFIYYIWLHFKQRCYFLCCGEKELAAVKIKAADVDIIANKLEVSASYFN